ERSEKSLSTIGFPTLCMSTWAVSAIRLMNNGRGHCEELSGVSAHYQYLDSCLRRDQRCCDGYGGAKLLPRRMVAAAYRYCRISFNGRLFPGRDDFRRLETKSRF